jgi:photosystem II stability/assembly factor-like uncharacterized protein
MRKMCPLGRCVRTLLTSFSIFCAFSLPMTAQAPPKHLPHATTPWTPMAPGPHVAAVDPTLSTSSWSALGPAPVQLSGDVAQTYSGRITGIATHPSDANTIYIAAAGGGVWKTTDGGLGWTALTDSQATLSMGALAVAPTNPNRIYAGTGEANNSGDSNYGRGVLISSDGGVTWSLSNGPAGIFDRLTISQIAVDPSDADVAYLAIASFGENVACCATNATGIYKTTDGGVSWTNKTASDGLPYSLPWTAVVIDPANRQVLYAALSVYYGSDFNGVYKSTNGGNSWTLLSNGPTGASAGRIALALAPSNDQILYVVAAAPAPQAGIYQFARSNNGGTTFTDLTGGTPNFVGSQGWYDLVVAVDPSTPSTVYLGGSVGLFSVLRSIDSGVTLSDISIGGLITPHADHHAFTFDSNGKLLDGDDGGIFRLDDPVAPSWSDLNGNLNTIQFSGIGLHPTNANIAVGGSQDNGAEIYNGGPVWTETDGGDGGLAKISQQDGNLVYHQIPVDSFGPNFFRVSTDGGGTWNTATSGIVADQDFQNFYAPFIVDSANGRHVLYGTNRVWETTTSGSTWNPISNIGVAGFNGDANIFVDAIALAPSDPNTIYAVENQFFSQVYATTDHGATWTEHTILENGARANDIQVDPSDSQTAYVALNAFSLMGNVFRTVDGGTTWTNISGNLPNEPVWSIQIDAMTTPHTLYAGADDGVYASSDLGISWRRFGTGFPHAQAVQLELNRNLHVLGAATHGRGAWEILTPAPTSGPAVVSYSVLFGTEIFNLSASTRNRLPWQITGIQVTFSEPVVTGTANSLTGANVTNFSGLGTTTLTWTISPLTNVNVVTVLSANGANALKDAVGNPLNGGTDVSQNVKLLWGDFNDDGVVNASDLVGVNTARAGAYNIFGDMNGNGSVDANDVNVVRKEIGQSLP